MLGLGAAALGDAATARSIAGGLTAATASSSATRPGCGSATTVADGRRSDGPDGDARGRERRPARARFWAYVEANPSIGPLVELHAIGFVERLLERAAATAGQLRLHVDGERTVVELEAGRDVPDVRDRRRSWPPSRSSRVTGSIGVTTTWREPVRPSTIEQDPDIRPAGVARPAPSDRLTSSSST